MRETTHTVVPPLSRWPFAPAAAFGRIESVATVLDRHARQVFGMALLFGVVAHLIGLFGVLTHSEGVGTATTVGIIAECVLVILFCYRRKAFEITRRRPIVLIPFSLFCAMVMVSDRPMYQSAYYEIAFVPFVFACFTGWRLWVVPAAAIAIGAYAATVLFVDSRGSKPLPADAWVFAASDLLEFALIAMVIAVFSGIFSRRVSRYLASAGSPDGASARRSRQADSFIVRLSPRELEVALLVATGMTNDEIAERLFLSTRTVEGHVAAARRKAGCSSRTALAVRVARDTHGARVDSIDSTG